MPYGCLPIVTSRATSERRSFYEAAVRPLLFRLPADLGHRLAQRALQIEPLWRLAETLAARGDDQAPGPTTRFVGVELATPIGLAAGFDKDADHLAALSRFGFGFLTIGSVMPMRRDGNPWPRLVRYPETLSLADAMGVPSKGLAHAAERLAVFAPSRRVPLFANVGGFDAPSIATSYATLAPVVDGVEVSLMCPNVRRGERFDDCGFLADVLTAIGPRPAPLVIRVPNDTAADPHRLAAFIDICIAGGVSGLKVGGGRPVDEPKLGTGCGTLHGRAIFARALRNVTEAVRLSRGRLDVKGNGGIFSAQDARAMLAAGCCCVDIYSALIYRGWSVARDIARELARAPVGS